MRFLRTPIDVRRATGYGFAVIYLTVGHCTREFRSRLLRAR